MHSVYEKCEYYETNEVSLLSYRYKEAVVVSNWRIVNQKFNY